MTVLALGAVCMLVVSSTLAYLILGWMLLVKEF